MLHTILPGEVPRTTDHPARRTLGHAAPARTPSPSEPAGARPRNRTPEEPFRGFSGR
jgi:hypothetical protein